MNRGGKRPNPWGGGGGWLKGGGCWCGGKGPLKWGGLCKRQINQKKGSLHPPPPTTIVIDYHMPACVAETGAPFDPKGAAQAGFPTAAAAQRSSRPGGPGLTRPVHSRDLLLWEDPHPSSQGLSGHSTCCHGCSTEGKEGGADLGQTEAEKGTALSKVRSQNQKETNTQGVGVWDTAEPLGSHSII